MEVFDNYFKGFNQIYCKCEEVVIDVKVLLVIFDGIIIEVGIWENIWVGIFYFESWLCGKGVVVLFYKMEDVVIVEISCI